MQNEWRSNHRRNFKGDGGPDPHFLKRGDGPNFMSLPSQKLYLQNDSNNAEYKLCNLFKRQINWLQFVAHITTRSNRHCSYMTDYPITIRYTLNAFGIQASLAWSPHFSDQSYAVGSNAPNDWLSPAQSATKIRLTTRVASVQISSARILLNIIFLNGHHLTE